MCIEIKYLYYIKLIKRNNNKKNFKSFFKIFNLLNEIKKYLKTYNSIIFIYEFIYETMKQLLINQTI